LLPGKDEDAIVVGPIRLNLFKSTVRCHGKLTRLTPQLVSLLKLLIKRNGRVVSRKEIMQHVWRTSYMGDTRTLDVHISWLRKAIEPDIRSPKFIKTVRGLGYRLDI
jgi:DNA-binding response OmpR family regulator